MPTATFSATVVNQRPLLFSFDGHDATAGRFSEPEGLAIDNSGNAYVLNVAGVGKGPGPFDSQRVVDKFNSEGVAENFSAIGKSSLDGSATPGGAFGVLGFFGVDSIGTDLAVDNSAVNPGRIYVAEAAGPIHAFGPDGSYLWTLPSSAANSSGIAVDGAGRLWVVEEEQRVALEFASSGSPPAQINSVPLTAGNGLPVSPAIDQTGNDLYVADNAGSGSPSIEKYVGGIFDSTVTTAPAGDIAIDQSSPTGHLFAIHSNNFGEFDSSDTPIPGSPFGDDLIGADTNGDFLGAKAACRNESAYYCRGRGIAYNPSKDWVYVSDLYTNAVQVFGPVASGTAPDVATQSTDAITRTEATVHGTINPQGVPNSYHFEYVRGEAQEVKVEATGGSFTLSTGGSSPAFTAQMPFDVTTATLQAELEALYGNGNVSVTGTPAGGGVPGEYDVVFGGGLAGHVVNKLGSDASSLTGGSQKVAVRTVSDSQPWAAASPQPTWPESNPRIEPTDSADHAVSLPLTGLRPNTTYDVRLVGTNTEPEGDPEKRLNAYSAPDTFTTLPPPLPSVTNLSIPAVEITTESAHISATIDPSGDETIWQILTSTEAKAGADQAECEGLAPLAFDVAEEATIPLGEPGTVDVERDLTGLEHSQTYCVRLVATNGGGSANADAVFTTGVVKPTEVKLAFAAPRTDTTARLNAYVNPEGEAPLTYRFEYSTDGVSWTALPEQVSTTEARRQIVVGEDAASLTPETTYFYRLALVENEAGEVPKASLPAKKAFTTRTTAEMSLPPNALGEPEKRGIELVNNPDKGNQHVIVFGFGSGSDVPVTADGNKMVWTLGGGASGGTSGVYNAFLATRTPSGWSSRGLLPPAEEQVGGGNLKYRADFASPDFTRFIFRTEAGLLAASPQSTYLRLDADRRQEVLAHFDANAFSTAVDVTADTAHVLHTGEDTNLLEDIGSGTPEVVGLMPGGAPPVCGIHYDTEFRGPNSTYAYPGYQWIARTDASRVYFQTRGSNCSGPEGLYMRNRDAGTTTQIAQSASFIRASTDGRSGFFTSTEGLASNDKNSDLDVYEWTEGVGAKCLTCVVPDANVSPLHGGIRVSDDFSHVYFLSTNQLVSGLGKAGELNLYALSGGSLRFVADPDDANLLSGPGQMEMSDDGNVVVFQSGTQLAADRVAPSCVNANNKDGHPCRELYRYDDRDGSIECLSCVRGGTTSEEVFTENNNGGQSFRISRDGSTVAFTTAQSLLPADINGGYDVYEWRNGAIRLISDGETQFPTGLAAPDLVGIDANGENIFFVLADPGLTGYERDGVDNVYDARIGGGFPHPIPPTHCSDESCQGPLQGAPEIEQPASLGFSGRGNVSPRRKACRHGKVRRHGRCVNRKRHRRSTHATKGEKR